MKQWMAGLSIVGFLFGILPSPAAGGSHLLISEVLINSPGGGSTENNEISSEFVEIYNPTGSPINLGDYILTDYPEYYRLPAGNFDYGSNSYDYMVRFPSNTMLAAGQIAVVTLDASTFLLEAGSSFGGTVPGFKAQPGSPLLFEIKDSNPAVPDMVNYKAAAPNPNTFLKDNAGEFVALIYWNGSSDLVSDIDMVRWGRMSISEQIKNKQGVSIDGPDADTLTTSYQTDALATHFNFIVVDAMVRKTPEEVFELNTGGNGLSGHDETSENLTASFEGVTNTHITPGLPHPDLVSSGVDLWISY